MECAAVLTKSLAPTSTPPQPHQLLVSPKNSGSEPDLKASARS